MKYLYCRADMRFARAMVNKVTPTNHPARTFLARASGIGFLQAMIAADLDHTVVDEKRYPRQHSTDVDPIIIMEAGSSRFHLFAAYLPNESLDRLEVLAKEHFSDDEFRRTIGSDFDRFFGDFLPDLHTDYFRNMVYNSTRDLRAGFGKKVLQVGAALRAEVSPDLLAGSIGSCNIPFKDISVTVEGFNGCVILEGRKVTVKTTKDSAEYTLALSMAHEGIEVDLSAIK
ncbi:hypothetical protein HY988_07520 [Candidatus Micrarchaeota archaeon]|nr:hypothetical protein [Candidatus Micrarchaeota archaeon]